MIKNGWLILSAALALLMAGCSTGQTAQEETQPQAETAEAANRLEAVRQRGTLQIGISADYAPYLFETPGGEDAYGGSDVELGKYIAESLGVSVEFQNMEFDECLEAVQDGGVDMVLLGMLPKAERRSRMDFTDVYYEPGRQVLLAKAERAEKYMTLDDLAGETVAAQYGTLQAQLVTEQLPESYMELTDDVSQAVLMVRMGTADAAALDETVAADVMEEHPELCAAQAELSCAAQGLVGGVVKGETELLEAVNTAIGEVVEEHLYFQWLEQATTQAKE